MNKIVIANWKMQLGVDESINLAKEINQWAEKEESLDNKIAICPSFLVIHDLSKFLGDKVALGAQDVFYEKEGAFTGEVSPKDLTEIACKYVILGHSERRAMGETYDIINKKVSAVMEMGMTPIICVGEQLEDRDAGNTDKVLQDQVMQALKDLPNQEFIIAYEPVWAISTSGSGQTITPEIAAEEVDKIKSSIPDNLDNYKIIYGGSVNGGTVADFTKYFEGALVGGASLKLDKFIELIKNA